MSEKECKLEKKGTDGWIGAYYSAPCGWSTYNRYDISHYEWHRRFVDAKESTNAASSD